MSLRLCVPTWDLCAWHDARPKHQLLSSQNKLWELGFSGHTSGLPVEVPPEEAAGSREEAVARCISISAWSVGSWERWEAWWDLWGPSRLFLGLDEALEASLEASLEAWEACLELPPGCSWLTSASAPDPASADTGAALTAMLHTLKPVCVSQAMEACGKRRAGGRSRSSCNRGADCA